MFVIIGWVVVTVSVLGGYMAMGGKLGPLWQPFELVTGLFSSLRVRAALSPCESRGRSSA